MPGIRSGPIGLLQTKVDDESYTSQSLSICCALARRLLKWPGGSSRCAAAGVRSDISRRICCASKSYNLHTEL